MRDIQYILELWGNWARCRFGTEYPCRSAGVEGAEKQSGLKLECSENDAMIIEGALNRLKNIKTLKANDEYKVLEYYYLGKYDQSLQRYIKLSIRDIAKEMNISGTQVRYIRTGGEGFIEGCLYMLDIKLECEI